MENFKDSLGTILKHWNTTVGEPREIETTHEKPDELVVSTWFVTAQDGKRFVLKNVTDRAEAKSSIASEIDVLQHLHNCGVPVAVPVLTDDGKFLLQTREAAYLMIPVLPADDGDAPLVRTRVLYTNIGRALAKLHRALASYPGQIDSWTMNLPKTIIEEAVPQIERSLSGGSLENFHQIFSSFKPEMNQALAQLPTQYIHGDCHGGNYLLYQGDVSGFIDLDHLPYGPRCYDIAYVIADFAKAPLFGSDYHENWLDNFTHVLREYEQVEKLSEQERAALWPMMLAIQLMFAYWLFKHQSIEAATKNLESFYWLYKNEVLIKDRIRN